MRQRDGDGGWRVAGKLLARRPDKAEENAPPDRAGRRFQPPWPQLLAFGREAVLVAILLGIYQGVRHFVGGQMGVATHHAQAIWNLERTLLLPNEEALQDWALGWGPAAKLANLFYVGAHFPGTAVVMVWLWFRHRPAYLRMRTELALLTGAGLVLHVLFPLAPPRLMPEFSMTDTMLSVGPSAYPSTTDGFANQFAAMPSLHVGWAILVAVAVIRVLKTPWRWLALLHPVVTMVVVVITANHYVLDAVAGIALVSGALWLSWALYARCPRPLLVARARVSHRLAQRTGRGTAAGRTAGSPATRCAGRT